MGVSRGPYEHYAIYAGNGRVIHYCGEGSDFNGRVSVHEAPFDEFLKGSRSFFVLSFEGDTPGKIHFGIGPVLRPRVERYPIRISKTYSREETLKRAYSRIGEEKYNILTNNCEHFALWCKTGRSESTQVKTFIRLLAISGVGLTDPGLFPLIH